MRETEKYSVWTLVCDEHKFILDNEKVIKILPYDHQKVLCGALDCDNDASVSGFVTVIVAVRE